MFVNADFWRFSVVDSVARLFWASGFICLANNSQWRDKEIDYETLFEVDNTIIVLPTYSSTVQSCGESTCGGKYCCFLMEISQFPLF